MSKKETEALDTFLEEGLITGKLQKCKSPYVSLFFFRLKHGMDKLWGIQDYWGLNTITNKKKDRYPLLLLLRLIKGAAIGKIYMQLDLGKDSTWCRGGKETKRRLLLSPVKDSMNHWSCSLGCVTPPVMGSTDLWLLFNIFKPPPSLTGL